MITQSTVGLLPIRRYNSTLQRCAMSNLQSATDVVSDVITWNAAFETLSPQHMLAKRIDRIVESTKWFAAAASLVSIPPVLYALWLLLMRATSYPFYSTLFVFGIVLFVALCRTSVAQWPIVLKAIELERDLTQTVLAFVMLHPVVGFGGNQTKGSRVRWLGRGNWLMLSAPYFIPTAAILLWLVACLIPVASLRCVVLGFGASYHVTAVYLQWQTGTSEMRRLGNRFCSMFLPGANLFVLGCIAAFALDGIHSVGLFIGECAELPISIWNGFWNTVSWATSNDTISPTNETPAQNLTTLPNEKSVPTPATTPATSPAITPSVPSDPITSPASPTQPPTPAN